MPRKYIVLGVVVAILILANLLQWWPDSSNVAGADSADAIVQIEDIRLRVPTVMAKSERRLRRNIFVSESDEVAYLAMNAERQEKSREASRPKQYPAKEIARTEMRNIRVMGIIFRNGKGRAYITIGERNYTVFQGDYAGRRYIADKIRTDAVVFRDAITGVSTTVIVSGQ